MPLFKYGEYAYACRHIPSIPTCNLFLRLISNPSDASLADAGVGVNPICAIPRMHAAGGAPGNFGNIANIIVAGLSFFISIYLLVSAFKRHAAVARSEIQLFFAVYALTNVFQILDLGSFLRQASTAIVWVTAIHLALVVLLFWILLWIAILSTQKIDDGRFQSYIPLAAGSILFFIGSAYIFLDSAFSVSGYFDTSLDHNLHNAWIFSLTIVWPAVAALIYFLISFTIVVAVLKERNPLIFFGVSAICFILSQAAYFALSQKICTGTNARIDGSFVATILETFAVVALFYGWKSITETDWDDYTTSTQPYPI